MRGREIWEKLTEDEWEMKRKLDIEGKSGVTLSRIDLLLWDNLKVDPSPLHCHEKHNHTGRILASQAGVLYSVLATERRL